MKSHSTIEGFVSGSASVYQSFWTARAEEWASYSDLQHEEIGDYLSGQVFGPESADEDEEDSEMEREFNRKKLEEISAGASREEGDREKSGVGHEDGDGDGDSRGEGKDK